MRLARPRSICAELFFPTDSAKLEQANARFDPQHSRLDRLRIRVLQLVGASNPSAPTQALVLGDVHDRVDEEDQRCHARDERCDESDLDGGSRVATIDELSHPGSHSHVSKHAHVNAASRRA